MTTPNTTPNTSICTTCNKSFPHNRFSLQQSTNSQLRKRYCIYCEQAKKKASKLNLTLDQYQTILLNDCSFCGQKAKKILTDANNIPTNTCCDRCSRLLTQDPTILNKITAWQTAYTNNSLLPLLSNVL